MKAIHVIALLFLPIIALPQRQETVKPQSDQLANLFPGKSGPDLEIPELLISAVVSKHVSCFGGSDAEAVADATGGVPPYTWLWSNALTDPVIDGQPAGTFLVTVADSQGNTAQAEVSITQPPPLSVSISTTNPDTFGASNGTAMASASGGSPPYTYSWNDASEQQTATAVNLMSGYYSCFVTDSHDCTTIALAKLSNPDPFAHVQYNAFIIQLKSGATDIIAADDIRSVRFDFFTRIDESAIPQNVMVTAINYPNPFSHNTTIQFELWAPANVDIFIYNITGRMVRRLSCQNCPEGSNQISWDGRDEGGNPLNSGVYIYRLIHDNLVSSHRMILVK